ncbi:hypothetical protein RIR_jg376.t1 [Rhizophagus irregularis DAOM 181602=DAOM 197198]|nr:hypothetical protein RIR_jg376.t1 [Rhizophagus irregularis DAOM 181602=DAOM 197198]
MQLRYTVQVYARTSRELLVANEQICFGLSMWCKCEGSIGQNLQIGHFFFKSVDMGGIEECVCGKILFIHTSSKSW